MNQIPVTFKRSPLRTEIERHTFFQGMTIEEILLAIPGLPLHIWTHGVVFIGDWEIPRDRWSVVRPKSDKNLIMLVGIRYAGGGGGGDGGGGKDPFATIAAIALLAVATFITAGGLAGTALASATGLSFTAGSTSAGLLAAGVSVAGALAVNALTPSPTTQTQEDDTDEAGGSASVQGNTLGIFQPIPYVIGKRRVSPPHLILPWNESLEDDQFAHAIVGLEGAHQIEDIEINDTPINEMDGVEYETRDVVNDNSDVTLITQQVFEDPVELLMSQHVVKDGAKTELRNVETPSESYPVFHTAQSKDSPDEIWINLSFSSLVWTPDESSGQIAFRIGIRRQGDSGWVELPEIHLVRLLQAPFKATIKLSWLQEDFSLLNLGVVTGGETEGNTTSIWKAAYIDVAAEGFSAHGYFDDGSGIAEHIRTDKFTATFFLDESIFPKGIYDVRIKRSYSFQSSKWSFQDYTISTNEPYLFTHIPASDPPEIREDQGSAPAKTSWQTISSVWDEKPLGENGLTLIAIRAKNISVSKISAIFTGYANVWSGSEWGNFEPTTNPAAWFRSIALGDRSIRQPFVESQLDDPELVEWFNYCEDKSLGANAYIQNRTNLSDVLKLIAAAGTASARQSEKLSVVIDRSRENESPVQIFSQRNAAGLTMRRAFPEIPHGFRVRFDDEDDDYIPKEIFIFRNGFSDANATDIEEMVYRSITNEQQAKDRALLDFGQLTDRGVLYEFDCDVEHLFATKGTMIGLAYDVLARHHGAARVSDVLTQSDLVTGLILDDKLRLHLVNDLGLVADLGDPTDLGQVETSGVAIQLKDGSTIVKEIQENEDTDEITFVEPFEIPTFLAGSDVDNAIEDGCLVVSGPIANVYKRCFVLSVSPKTDLTARIIAVDEAPQITRPQLDCSMTASASMSTPYGVIGITIITKHAVVQGDTLSLTIPSTAKKGDIVIFVERVNSPQVQLGIDTPVGFTTIDNGGSFADETIQNLSFRVLESDDEAGDEVVGRGSGDEDRSSRYNKILLVFRPDGIPRTVTVNDVASETTDVDPSSQTVNASGGTQPLIVGAVYGSSGSINSRTFNPAEDEEINQAGDEDFWFAYKIYDAEESPGPLDHTIDMPDEGSNNILQSFYLEVS